MNRILRPRQPARQSGAALLMAMVIVTVVATIASSMVWQQWRAVQVESAERGRQQSEWLLVGALDFARLVLKDDGRRMQTGGQPEPTHLAQQWAQDLKEMRLSTFLAVDKDNTDDAPDAFLSGKVVDVNARFNLRNVLENNGPGGATINQDQLKMLMDLFAHINLPPSLAVQIADALKTSTLAAMDTQQSFAALGGNAGRAAAPLMPQRLDQLTWLLPKLDAGTVERMRPYVALLPYQNGAQGTITPINVNTAPKEVIAAVWGIDPATAERIVRARQSHYFETEEEAAKQVPNVQMPADSIKVTSEYFEVTGVLRLEDQIMKNRHLVRRTGAGKQVDVVVLNQERFSGVDPGP